MSFERLCALRDSMGWVYGSEDLCVLLYSLVKRARPRTVIELGTGFGVTAAWMGIALRESGLGFIHTYDNGSHFCSAPGQRFLETLHGPLAESMLEPGQGYLDFLGRVFSWAGVEDQVKAHVQDICVSEIAQSPEFDEGIDILFSDFSHSQQSIQALLGAFIPRMSDSASIFIDSASTQRLSCLTLESLIGALNQNKIPRALIQGHNDEDTAKLVAKIQRSRFRLMHLVEARERAQNSTAWISIEPVDVIPTSAPFLH